MGSAGRQQVPAGGACTAFLALLLACQTAAQLKGGTTSVSDPLDVQPSIKQKRYNRPVSTEVDTSLDNVGLKAGGGYKRESYRRVPSGYVPLREPPYDSSVEDRRAYGKVRYHHGSGYPDNYGQPDAPEETSGQESYKEEPAYGGEAYMSSVYTQGSYSRDPVVSTGYSKGSRTKGTPVKSGYVGLPYVHGVYGSGYPKPGYVEVVPVRQAGYSPSYEGTKFNRGPSVFNKGGAGKYSYGPSGRYPPVHEGYVVSGYKPISAGPSGFGVFDGYGQGSAGDVSQERITPHVGYYGRYRIAGYVPRDFEAVIQNRRPKSYGGYGNTGAYGDGYLGAAYAGGSGSGKKTWQRTVSRNTVPIQHGFAEGLVASKTSVSTYPVLVGQLDRGPNQPFPISAKVPKTSRYWR